MKLQIQNHHRGGAVLVLALEKPWTAGSKLPRQRHIWAEAETDALLGSGQVTRWCGSGEGQIIAVRRPTLPGASQEEIK